MKAEIITVGTELLLGYVVNTDAQYLSRELSELGIDVFYHHVVGDNRERLAELIRKVYDRSDIIILTGGLGPTEDDITKETMAEVFGLNLVLHEPSLQNLNCFFHKINRNCTPNNRKQAYFPENCTIFKNDRGTAPGCGIEIAGKTIIILPGPPRELTHMFANEVKPYLEKKSGFVLKTSMLKVIGIGEAELEHLLIDIIDNQTNPTIATYASAGEVSLRITAKAGNGQEAERMLNPVVKSVYSRIGEYIYSDSGATLQEHIVDRLSSMDMRLSLAESCTGGMLASMIVDVPGASKVLDNCIVSYSNEAKMTLLEVSADTLEKFGAVSAETAREMAKNSFDLSNSDLSLSITGIAGDKNVYSDKPIGLIYICLYDGRKYHEQALNLNRDRNFNRLMTCMRALDMVRRYLNSIENAK